MTQSTDPARPYINYTQAFSRQMACAMDSRQVDALVLTPLEYVGILQDKARHDPPLAARLHAILARSTLGLLWTQTASPNAGKSWTIPAALAATDGYLITRTLLALRFAGAGTYIRTTARGSYIIIKGRAGFRRDLLQGTRYLSTHPRMIQMGLGIRGLQNVAKGGFILGVVVSTAIETLDFIFNDEKTMHDLVGGIGVEAVKAGLATSIGLAAGTYVAGFTTVAITPLIIMAVFVFAAGIFLNEIDKGWQIKKSVISTIQGINDQTPQGLYRVITGISDESNPCILRNIERIK